MRPRPPNTFRNLCAHSSELVTATASLRRSRTTRVVDYSNSQAVATQRGVVRVAHSFVLGAVLGVIGVIILIVQRPNLPEPPPGMRAVRCARCNAVQNIPHGQTTFECWQCKLVSNVAGAGYVAGKRGPDGPEDTREWLNRTKKEQEDG